MENQRVLSYLTELYSDVVLIKFIDSRLLTARLIVICDQKGKALSWISLVLWYVHCWPSLTLLDMDIQNSSCSSIRDSFNPISQAKAGFKRGAVGSLSTKSLGFTGRRSPFIVKGVSERIGKGKVADISTLVSQGN